MLSAVSPEAEESDPLVAETAKRIANVINDFKRQLDQRDRTWATATGQVELALDSQTFLLTIVPDLDGDEYPITVYVQAKTPNATNVGLNSPPATKSSTYKSTRRETDAELERDLVSRKKRKLEEDGDASNKRPRTADDEEDIMPLITMEDLDDLLSKLREDVQEDTSECVNHVQRLLRQFKEEWHEKTQHAYGYQIKWVEDCRRVAAGIHDKSEDTWRTTSAGCWHESSMNTQTLNQILNEVKAIGLIAQSMEWETPSSHLMPPTRPEHPPQPTAQTPVRTPSRTPNQSHHHNPSAGRGSTTSDNTNQR
ncbi:hypothetical protein EK21DRAFT_103052 [Setomelanomma holmii]|uniref:Uncharacterized protein n=1 Tax=Setomelanomma holmii TaxID=210430 RepID=A0A9P4H3G2_9PLEO|nr:hypothetical protein EK21DRAFT_103052 [Setomelanomma holmii]